MACPCFLPLERMPQATGKKIAPMPLGDCWSGVCRSVPEGEWLPDPHTLQQFCNFGYARAKCGRVPADKADAVRFTISQDREGLVRIYWVIEKDHLPLDHGPLEYSRGAADFQTAHPDACVARQAQAYVSSYLRRLGDARRP
jgi:hypothetical protein